MSSIRAALKTSLPAELVAAGAVAEEADVYFGRQPQHVRKGQEAWVEAFPSDPGAINGMQQTTRHAFLVHVYKRGNQGAGQRGEAVLGVVEPALHAIRARLQGRIPSGIKTEIPGLIHVEAVVEEVDEEPEENNSLEGTVRLTFTVAE